MRSDINTIDNYIQCNNQNIKSSPNNRGNNLWNLPKLLKCNFTTCFFFFFFFFLAISEIDFWRKIQEEKILERQKVFHVVLYCFQESFLTSKLLLRKLCAPFWQYVSTIFKVIAFHFNVQTWVIKLTFCGRNFK